jgi:large subunit ribosomal protein L21
MYAVLKTGGKQYRVAPGDVIRVEKLPAEVGTTVDLDHILMVGGDDLEGGPRIGTPVLEGARVAADVLDQARGPKVIVFKKRRRKNYRRTAGHRQHETVLRIRDIAVA